MTQAQSQPGVIAHSPVQRSDGASYEPENGGIMRPVSGQSTQQQFASERTGGLGHEQKVGRTW